MALDHTRYDIAPEVAAMYAEVTRRRFAPIRHAPGAAWIS